MNDTNKVKAVDEIYCPECGAVIKRSSTFCMECGMQLKEKKVTTPEVERSKEVTAGYPKSKTVTILLAVFFGFWSWLYTYKKDYKKFWVYLCLNMLSTVAIIIILNLVFSGYSSKAFEDYGTWIWLCILINGSSSIWALVNSITRPESFYTNYPYGDKEFYEHVRRQK